MFVWPDKPWGGAYIGLYVCAARVADINSDVGATRGRGPGTDRPLSWWLVVLFEFEGKEVDSAPLVAGNDLDIVKTVEPRWAVAKGNGRFFCVRSSPKSSQRTASRTEPADRCSRGICRSQEKRGAREDRWNEEGLRARQQGKPTAGADQRSQKGS